MVSIVIVVLDVAVVVCVVYASISAPEVEDIIVCVCIAFLAYEFTSNNTVGSTSTRKNHSKLV